MHVEVFARNLVVLLPAGIGTAPPRRMLDGGVVSARCYGAVVSTEPTGVVLVRRGTHLTVADVFRSWGESLSATRLAGFTAPRGTRVRVYVGGRRQSEPARLVPLTPNAEIVLELAPFVPPHAHYTFPSGG